MNAWRGSREHGKPGFETWRLDSLGPDAAKLGELTLGGTGKAPDDEAWVASLLGFIIDGTWKAEAGPGSVASVEAKGDEEVKTPAGTFSCRHVHARVTTKAGPTIEVDLWRTAAFDVPVSTHAERGEAIVDHELMKVSKGHAKEAAKAPARWEGFVAGGGDPATFTFELTVGEAKTTETWRLDALDAQKAQLTIVGKPPSLTSSFTLPGTDGGAPDDLAWTRAFLHAASSAEACGEESLTTPAGTFACRRLRSSTVAIDRHGDTVGGELWRASGVEVPIKSELDLSGGLGAEKRWQRHETRVLTQVSKGSTKAPCTALMAQPCRKMTLSWGGGIGLENHSVSVEAGRIVVKQRRAPKDPLPAELAGSLDREDEDAISIAQDKVAWDKLPDEIGKSIPDGYSFSITIASARLGDAKAKTVTWYEPSSDDAKVDEALLELVKRVRKAAEKLEASAKK